MFRVRATATGVAGAPYYLTFYFAAGTATAQVCTDAVRAFISTARFAVTNSLSFAMDATVVTVDSVSGQPVSAVGVTPGVPIVGGSTAEKLPFQVQMGLKMLTGTYVGGRALQGHICLPGITELQSVSGSGPNLSQDDVVGVQTALTTLAAHPTADWVVWSRKGGNYAVVSQAVISPRWFTLRSRLY